MNTNPSARHATAGAFIFSLVFLLAGCLEQTDDAMPEAQTPEASDFSAGQTDGLEDYELEAIMKAPGAPAVLFVRGRVDSRIGPEATVFLTAGDSEFETTVDDDHKYRFVLPRARAGGMVRLRARGHGQYSHVEFASIAGTVARLAGLGNPIGGGDRPAQPVIVTADDTRRLHLNSITTSRRVLLKEVRATKFTTDAELARSDEDIGAAQLLSLASLVHVVVARPDFIPSAGTAMTDVLDPLAELDPTTLSIAEDESMREATRSNVVAENPDLLSDAENEILSNPEMVASFDPDAVPPEYWMHLNFAFHFIQGDYYRFDEGGTGHFVTPLGDHTFIWETDGHELTIDFDQPVLTEGFPVHSDTGNQERALTEFSTHVYTRLSEGDTSDALSLDRAGFRTYPDNPNLEPHDVEFRSQVTAARREALLPFDEEDLAGEEWAMPSGLTSFVGDGPRPGSEKFQFNADGSGSGDSSGDFVMWTLTEAGQLEILFADNSSLVVSLLRREDEFLHTHALHTTADGAQHVNFDLSIRRDPAITLESGDIVGGSFLQYDIFQHIHFDFLDSDTVNRVTYGADGTAFVIPSDWWIEEQDGRQRVTSQYWFEPDPLNTVVGKQASCETENCFPAQQRIWKPLLDTGDRLYAEEILFVDTAFGPGFDSKHRRNVFYQRSELD
jgi:hypothetical protein